MNNEVIARTNSEKYLGLILDNQLTWIPHIKSIKSKIISLTGALRNIVHCLPLNVRYRIYNSLVKPHLDYLIEIWGSAAKSNLKIIQITQNKLIKTLFKYDYLTSSEILYKKTKIMNVLQTYHYTTCILIRKILSKDIHTNITFTKKKQVQTRYQLRSANDLVLPIPRTNYGKRAITYKSAQLYNKLPKDIKEAKSLQTFKRLLKYHITKTKV